MSKFDELIKELEITKKHIDHLESLSEKQKQTIKAEINILIYEIEYGVH